MFDTMREDAGYIISRSIEAVLPDESVRRALSGRSFPGRVIPVAVGKAAWQMARAAKDALGDRLSPGIVITKYGHVRGPIPGMTCLEAGHPVPDENSFAASREALALTEGLNETDTVLFLLSPRSIPSENGFPPSKAAASRSTAPPRRFCPLFSATLWATLWT